MKISFDFDGTLAELGAVQDYCRKLVQGGFEVYIVTRRFRPGHPMNEMYDEATPVHSLAAQLGVPRERVIFTDREYKATILNELGIRYHLDDDALEGTYIRQAGGPCEFVCTDSTENPGLRNWRTLLDESLGLPPLRAPW